MYKHPNANTVRMVKLKWALRRRFNPKLTPNGKRTSSGVYSHNHIVHISDTDEGVDDLLRFFKLPTIETLVRSNRELMTRGLARAGLT